MTQSKGRKNSKKPDSIKDEYLHQHRQLQILLDISSALHYSPHVQDVLQRALLAILETLKFRMGSIYLLKDISDDHWFLELAAHHGFSSNLESSCKFLSLPADLMDYYLHTASVQWLTPRKIVFANLRQRMEQEGIKEILCIALTTQKKVQGLLYVTNDGVIPLRPDSRDFLMAIGHQIGVAIENAQLFDSVERARSELEISFDAIQHSIFLVDTRMRIYRVNRTSETVYGKDLVGKKYPSILYLQEQPHAECPIWACLWGGQPVQREGPHPRWGGYFRYYAFPVFNADRRLDRVVYYEKDITEARKMEQRLQQSERLKALGTLAAGIAHEIRNPLATINFNSQMLMRELALDGAQHQMFEDIAQEIKKIDRIVQQVLHFARPKEPQFLPNRINEVVRYCNDLAKVSLRKANVEVTLDLKRELPLLVMDFNQISQVVMNLFINSIEAMSNGGKIAVTTRHLEDARAIVLEMRDTGPGILEEDKSRIFDPFFTRKPEGTGLGLSIVRQILERHGADIEVSGAAGEGAIFRITFPLTESTAAVPVRV